MEYVQKIADFIMYIINYIKSLVGIFTGGNTEEETTGKEAQTEKA